MKKIMKICIMLLLFFSIMAGCGAAEPEEETPAEDTEEATKEEAKDVEITFGVTPWTSTIPPTYVAKQILEDMGYTVHLQSADAGAVYTGLSRGDIDVFMDSWLPDLHANYMERYGDTIDDTAVSYEEGELGWVIPADMDINSVEELQGNEDLFDGKIYGIDEGAGITVTSREIIEDYGLDLEYVSSSEAGMLSQARREIGQGNPVLFLGWRPHPMFVNWDLKVLEEDRGYFETSQVHVLTNIDFKDKAPEAYEFLSNWNIPVADVEEMIVKIDEGEDEDDVAREWIENNEQRVNEMKGE
ncbi:glycine betaine ABC transporter substrate-binding protein [Bacillus sp. FJAT-45350]|uniref:glycine betaine ABC transporter substrate-binding protein n=1 Tax=Bacillus sp. FJAT-45350 TaxID=2011014 RepID=UPI000BB9B3EE|nr:glycine betaine ABC transporter substrate-binding protein [Bacillus sp. FJAT-45350]